MLIQCPPCGDHNREQLPAQRVRHREFIPVGLLAVIRILTHRNSDDVGLITFRSRESKR